MIDATSGSASPAGSYTTLTLCGYAAPQRFWAFNQMGSSGRHFRGVAGLRFWRLLGTGRGLGFTLRPDFSRYGFLCVWESRIAALHFLAGSTLMQRYRAHAAEIWTVHLAPLGAHGTWAGTNPFLPAAADPHPHGPIAVLTRASIRLRQLTAFWRAVPATSAALAAAPGLLASIGTGELPFIRPATFSLWSSEAAMQDFAYGTPAHARVIEQRRVEGWYAEELFARFRPLATEGTWNGRDPLEGRL